VYEFIRGTVISRGNGAVVLETGGVGYRLVVSGSTQAAVPPSGEFLLLTHHVVRDDRAELFGFAEESERHLFRQLLIVSGVGPAAALGLLSTFESTALASHIASGDAALLTRAKGIGKRTAERILVELRDKLAKSGVPIGAGSGVRADAILALCSLGLARSDAESRVALLNDENLEVEEIVRRALRP
jgi:Holliday junction DNA helicase RuvA